MAKIDFKVIEFKDLAGKVFQKPDETKSPYDPRNPGVPQPTIPVSVADMIQTCLLLEDTKVTPTERFDFFRLASKIKDGEGEIDFTLEELATIKKKAGENPNPLVLGRIWEVLNKI